MLGSMEAAPNEDLTPAGARARGMNERRQRLVRAAKELINERENGEFSMPELAARAGLSLATPYNLFGSKAAILEAVFQREIEHFHAVYATIAPAPPVDRVLAVIEHLLQVLERKPHFYRALSRGMATLGAAESSRLISPLSDLLLRPLVEGLVDDGAIRLDLPKSMLTAQITRMYEATMQRWVRRGWDDVRMRSEMRAAILIVCLGMFGEEFRAELLAALYASALPEPAPESA
ncbi:TetR/AcrR family transcriptional regulator [Sphingomonas montanisoli]|uniref:TetR/AcrR family transcriptional regulator n=2 Tax=Sphingomonas montanisoli TaxID=2606412 RepID=A0A5D9C0K9_9SPHN|nr:TetR/AcrR family transcriptional regulator [Sphingomonas montanisoli]